MACNIVNFLLKTTLDHSPNGLYQDGKVASLFFVFRKSAIFAKNIKLKCVKPDYRIFPVFVDIGFECLFPKIYHRLPASFTLSLFVVKFDDIL